MKFQITDEFEKIYKRSKAFTMTSPERTTALFDAVNYVSLNKIEGDIVECGVWRGGSSMVIASTLLACNDTNRHIYMYDTYEGMPEPTQDDVNINGKKAIETTPRKNYMVSSVPRRRSKQLKDNKIPGRLLTLYQRQS